MFNTQILAGSSGQGGETQQSLKFNDDESQYLSWTPAAAGNRKTWTWSGWVKRGNLGTNQVIFSTEAGAGNNNCFILGFTSANQLDAYDYTSGAVYRVITNNVYRDTSAWYHILVAFDTTQATSSNRVKFYVNGQQITSFSAATYPSLNYDGYVNSTNNHYIATQHTSSAINSLDGYLSDVYFIDGQALDPTSFGQFTDGYWKKKDYSGSYGTNGFHLTFADDVVSEGFNTVTYRGTGAAQSVSGLGFSPDLVWIKNRTVGYNHLLSNTVTGITNFLNSNTTSAEFSSSVLTLSSDADGFSLGTAAASNGSGNSMVAWAWDAGENNAPTGHSSVTYTGSGSTQSIKGLGFSPDLVWIKGRNLAQSHNLVDSVRGDNLRLRSDVTNAEAVATVTLDSDGFTLGTQSETNNNGSSFVAWGWDAGSGSPVSNTDGSITSTVKANPDYGFSVVSWVHSSTTSTIGHGLTTAPNLIILKSRTTAYNWDVGSDDIGWGNRMNLNSTAAAYSPAFWNSTAPTSSVFTYEGSGATNGDNMIAYCFAEVAGYSKISSYSGTGSDNTVSGLGFRPSFVMIKRTDSTGYWTMMDNTRNPTGELKNRLWANATDAESVAATANYIETTSDGFTVIGGGGDTNASGGTYIYMAFKGSYTDYVSDLNTDGTIESRVKANPSYGFSIASYTGNGTSGATVGHGLGVTPDMVIVKNRTTSGTNWPVFHSSQGTGSNGYLDITNSWASGSTWGSTQTFNSTVFSVGSQNYVNNSGDNMIAYCFAEVAGYSSFGSYSGTGASGNSITGLGFKPAFILVKRTDAVNSWYLLDNTRNPSGDITQTLAADGSGAEGTQSTWMNLTADGFDIQTTSPAINASGGTYIYMAFADTREAAFWKDVSGQGNHWTPNNLDYRDSLIDSPANSFATFNPVSKALYQPTFSNGNLSLSATTAWSGAVGAIGVTSGKWYWEVINGDADSFVGICADDLVFSASDPQTLTGTILYYGGGYKRIDGVLTSYGTAYSTETIGVALDIDGGTITFYKNNVSQGSISLSSSTLNGKTILPYFTKYGSTMIVNFGQDSTFAGARPAGGNTDAKNIGDFAYAPPSGYLALCTANLPTPTIVDGSEHFNTVLWTGDAAQTRSLSGLGFQPDFSWLKIRSGTTQDHQLYDSVRGAGSGKNLSSNTTAVEGTVNTVSDGDYGFVSSFDADGFSVDDGAIATTGGYVNYSGRTYAAWNWLAGGTAVSNTDGSITSQVSANVDAGFSIVSYTGTGSAATVGHGLSSTPEMVIVKNRTSAGYSWVVGNDYAGTWSGVMFLNTTAAWATNNNQFNSTAPTSSVFTVGIAAATNGSSDDMIAYCFHSVEGFSKVGSYTGNGSTDGPMVFTGGRVQWLMIKRADSTGNWYMWDDKRHPGNDVDNVLYADLSNAESVGSSYGVDFLSNGFKVRHSGTDINASGGSYIYLAIMESPLKFSPAR